ncbi:hypothetical protein HFN98_24670 [Rhizobium laguerreae]|uniref:hypothetical protein n=1 Tax=Rhizobium laguerreae TaxID=1076926 RepID=UPI001C928E2F|nr:hypothetical protein [Rhizobium laguerreae]MBY3333788.1 hypothetical protein [Rhizobium laguerreae]
MSRQTERAAARHQAKIDRANESKPGSYPASRYVPVQPKGKAYPFSSARQNTKYASLTAGTLRAAA